MGQEPEQRERQMQVVGLLLLAAGVVAYTVLRAGVDRVFAPAGWWRLW